MNVQFVEDYAGLHTGGVKYLAGDVAEVNEHAGHALVHRLGVAVEVEAWVDSDPDIRPALKVDYTPREEKGVDILPVVTWGANPTPRPLPPEPQEVTKNWKPELRGRGKAKR